MGFFDILFGSSSSSGYDKREQPVTKEQIQMLVSRAKTRSLDATEERLIEETIIKRRKGNGKISLRQIDEALGNLEGRGKISAYDRKGVRRVFKTYFEKR